MFVLFIILILLRITIANILFHGLCNIYIEATDRERTRGNRQQLLFQAGVKSHSLVMRKFVHSSRELFPHLVDGHRDYGVHVHDASMQTRKIGVVPARRTIR